VSGDGSLALCSVDEGPSTILALIDSTEMDPNVGFFLALRFGSLGVGSLTLAYSFDVELSLCSILIPEAHNARLFL